jgi:hypothetical protein
MESNRTPVFAGRLPRRTAALCLLALAARALPAVGATDTGFILHEPGTLLAAGLGRHVLADDEAISVSRDADAAPALGVRIGRYLAFETSHLALGITPRSAFALALPADPATSFVGSAMMSGLAVLPLRNDLDVYLRLAVPVEDIAPYEPGFYAPGPRLAPSIRSAGDLLWGVGLGYRIDDHWTGRVDLYDVGDYDYYRTDPLSDETMQLLFSIGLRYSF